MGSEKDLLALVVGGIQGVILLVVALMIFDVLDAPKSFYGILLLVFALGGLAGFIILMKIISSLGQSSL